MEHKYEVRTVSQRHYQVMAGNRRVLGTIPSLKEATWLCDKLNENIKLKAEVVRLKESSI
jgi:hypothetical protein